MGKVSMVIFTFVFIAAAYCGDLSDRKNVIGAWHNESEGNEGSTWVIKDNGAAIRITYSQNNQVLAEYDCAPGGRDCDAKDTGRTVKTSMWFNGPKLVQMETKGSEIVKRRFSAAGDELEIEIIPIQPDGRPQILHLKRIKEGTTK